MTSGSPILGHLQALHAAAAEAQLASASNHGASLGTLLQLDLDIKVWETALAGRPEVEQLSAARRELGMAIYAASSGLYVHAYAGLRVFLELSFAAVYFSANELHRRRWIADRRDFSWSKALDEEEGILSPAFVAEFSPVAVSDSQKYAADAARSYRHCSQFLHGKLAVTKALPEHLEFNSAILAAWLEHSKSSAKAVLYLLYARYSQDLVLDATSHLGTTLESNFPHHGHVRQRLGLATDGGVNREQ